MSAVVVVPGAKVILCMDHAVSEAWAHATRDRLATLVPGIDFVFISSVRDVVVQNEPNA